MAFRKQTISNVQENIAYNDQEWSFCMLLSVSGCVASHDDVANSRTQPLMSISGSTQLVGHRVDLRSTWARIQLRLFLENTLKKQPCHMMYRSSSTWQSVLVLHCHALLCAMHRYTVRGACMHFQHAFSSVYASFHVQSCAMCQSNMQIGYSDAPDIVIHFRKSKGHVISDIYCMYFIWQSGRALLLQDNSEKGVPHTGIKAASETASTNCDLGVVHNFRKIKNPSSSK